MLISGSVWLLSCIISSLNQVSLQTLTSSRLVAYNLGLKSHLFCCPTTLGGGGSCFLWTLCLGYQGVPLLLFCSFLTGLCLMFKSFVVCITYWFRL